METLVRGVGRQVARARGQSAGMASTQRQLKSSGRLATSSSTSSCRTRFSPQTAEKRISTNCGQLKRCVCSMLGTRSACIVGVGVATSAGRADEGVVGEGLPCSWGVFHMPECCVVAGSPSIVFNAGAGTHTKLSLSQAGGTPTGSARQMSLRLLSMARSCPPSKSTAPFGKATTPGSMRADHAAASSSCSQPVPPSDERQTSLSEAPDARPPRTSRAPLGSATMPWPRRGGQGASAVRHSQVLPPSADRQTSLRSWLPVPRPPRSRTVPSESAAAPNQQRLHQGASAWSRSQLAAPSSERQTSLSWPSLAPMPPIRSSAPLGSATTPWPTRGCHGASSVTLCQLLPWSSESQTSLRSCPSLLMPPSSATAPDDRAASPGPHRADQGAV
mmetsp:Transcript_102866/g.331878  ORF Transcript_102866/g.331878 Transcript_102866/m.331878 type:complete len:389 (+) Transcript_102866:347-1513(+)